MALVPWPEDAALIDAAILRIASSAFNDSTSKGQARALRFGPVAADLVEEYAPLAPDPIKDEALIRMVGWMDDKTNISIRAANLTLRKTRGRDELSALKYSGAGALLNPWKVRRAGKIA